MFNDFNMMVRSIGDIPPVPAVAAKVLQLLQDPTTSVKKLADTIAHDPGTSARILKLANSVYYGQQRNVTTLERAIILLGEIKVKNLVVETSLRGLNKSFHSLEKTLWEDSIGCASAARIIAEHLESADSEEAFLAGLFRHLGKMVMLGGHPESYRHVLEIVEEGKGELVDVERAYFAYSHEKIGAALLDHWNFPPSLVQVTLHHHDLIFGETEEEIRQLAAIVNLAGGLCAYLGIGRKSSAAERQPIDTPGARILALSRETLDEILADFQQTFPRERDFFLVSAD